jgi:hypothetical protein
MRLLLLILMLSIVQNSFAQFGPFYVESSSWGDYDNDGDLDLLLSSYYYDEITYDEIAETVLFRNNSGTLERTTTVLPSRGSTMWVDHNKDGNLDFIFNGALFLNQNLAFVNSGSVQQGLRGDYDNDGDLDILNGGTIFVNQGGGSYLSKSITIGISDFYLGSSKWFDYDNDGDLDLLCAGSIDQTGDGQNVTGSTILMTNENGVYSASASGIRGYFGASSEFGDFDADGDTDFAISGMQLSVDYGSQTDIGLSIYENRNTGFVEKFYEEGLSGLIELADVDSDGDLDVMVTGESEQIFSAPTGLFKNNSGSFSSSLESFPGTIWSQNLLDIVDLQNDGHIEVYMGDDSEGGTGGPAVYDF